MSFKTHPRLYTETYKDVICDTTTSVNTNQSGSNSEILAADQSTVCGAAAVTASHSSLQGNCSNTVMNSSAVCNMTKNFSYRIRYGIYAVRSFASIGTYVSYYNLDRKWNNFSRKSQNYNVLNVVSVKEKLYVFFPSAFQTFSLISYRWRILEPPASPVESSGIASYEDIIYVFGGCHVPNKIRCFDTQQNRWLEDETMQYPRRNMSVTSSPEKYIYLTGGYDTSCCNTFSKFHAILKKWTVLTPMRHRRMDHDSAFVIDKVYVCGGSNSTVKFLSVVEVYDSRSTQWSVVSHTKVRRHSHSLMSYGTKLYVFGGMTEKKNYNYRVDIFDPHANEWSIGIRVPSGVPRLAEATTSSSSPLSLIHI